MRRRHFLAASLVAPLSGAVVVSGCHRAPNKEQVLRSLADDVLALGVREAVVASHALQTAATALATAPSATTADAARSLWVSTAIKWKRANALRDPLLVQNNELVRGAFWPPRPRAIEELVSSDAPLGDGDVDKLGADVRSLYAMEYLLFAERSGSPFRIDAPEGARARQALVAFAAGVSRCANSVAAGLATSALGTRLAAQGQEAINRLVGVAVGNVESLVANRLATILWIGSTKRFRPIDVEGGPSGISHQLGAAVLEVTQRLYVGDQGRGLGALVAAVAPPIDQRIRSALAEAVVSIDSFREPLEAAALGDRSKIDALLAKCKALEIALRSDLASALGVTLTFTSNDAD